MTGCWMGAGGLVSLCSQRGAGCAAGKSAVPCPSVGQGCAAGERPNITQTNSVGKEAGGRQKLSLPRAHLELSRASSHTHTLPTQTSQEIHLEITWQQEVRCFQTSSGPWAVCVHVCMCTYVCVSARGRGCVCPSWKPAGDRLCHQQLSEWN